MLPLLWCLAVLAGCSGDSPQEVPLGVVGFVGLSGAPPSGSLWEDESFTLVASTYDRAGSLITGQAITWKTSDPAVLQLEDLGLPNTVRVHGRTAGSARITATAGGQQAYVDVAVRRVPVATVQVRPGSAALYPTLTLQLTVAAVDSFGRERTGAPVSWRSSDNSRARVSASGEVTGVAQGSATITATIEGVSGSAVVQVLSRPVADWSGVVDEWTMFQGNASHTGYVPATLDPVAFTHEWSTLLAPGAALTPATTGDGGVYVATDTYFGAQQLHVVDAATGQLRWTREFGEIHSVDPPAYANGVVYVQTGGHADSFLWALDADDDALLFRTPYGNQWSRWYAPVIADGRVHIAGGYYGGMSAVGASDGTELWFLALNQYDQWAPAVRDGRVYAYTGEYDPKVTVADAATGAVLYEIPDPNFSWIGWSMNHAPVLGSRNNLLGAYNGRLTSFDLGARTIAWTVPFAGSFDSSWQVSLGEGVVYGFANNQLEARRESDGTRLWTWVPPSGVLRNTIIVTRNLLFLTTDEMTFALDIASHRPVWTYPASGHLALGRDGRLLIARTDGTLTSIRVR